MARVERYVVLDGWRGICAMLVALFHFPMTWHFREASFVRGSWLFVDFFFVLSGFVIAHAYAGKLSSGRDLAAFLVRRVGRLWPLHVALMALLATMAGAKYLARGMGLDIEVTGNPENTPFSFLADLFFLHSFGLYRTVTWNTPSWSISAEFLTNVAFGIAFVLVQKRRILAALALSAVGACVLVLFSEKTIDTSAEFGLFRCFYGFFIGYVLYRIVVTYGPPLQQRSAAATLAEFAAIVACALFVAFCYNNPWRMAAPFVFALAIWIFATEQGALSRLLKRPELVVVGLLSYSIYMTHIIVISIGNNAAQLATKLMGPAAAARWLALFDNTWAVDAVVVAFVAAVMMVSWLTYHYIEVPWRRRFNRWAVEISPKREVQPVDLPLGVPERLPAL